MKFEAKGIFKYCKCASWNIAKSVFLLPFTLFIVTMVLLPLIRNLNQSSNSNTNLSSLDSTETGKCNIFSGHWAPNPKEPYYNNDTCPHIIDPLNCMKFGRPDREFIKLRWKPHECELPPFNATRFLKLVQGKSMAFVGDSMARNQMDSLLCLLNSVANLEDISGRYTSKYDAYFKWWFSADNNFTLTILWSPFLVKAIDADPRGSLFSSAMNLTLNEADNAWVSKIENFDYVVISAGQWFFRPLTFYEKGHVVGVQEGGRDTNLNLYGYRKAFQKSFRTIINLRGFKGLTFFVTHSPNHFEHGEWSEGGNCNRTKPFTKEERHTYNHGDTLKALYHIQLEEFREAEKEARKKGLHFGLIDISDAMAMRPDGHPDKYGRLYNRYVKVIDCVHWCLPGPVDTWNEFLLYMLKLEVGQTSTPI